MVLVCRPKRPKASLSEFLQQDESDFDLPRSYILGHNRYVVWNLYNFWGEICFHVNGIIISCDCFESLCPGSANLIEYILAFRLYHHTMSCLPIAPHELDEDSEGKSKAVGSVPEKELVELPFHVIPLVTRVSCLKSSLLSPSFRT